MRQHSNVKIIKDWRFPDGTVEPVVRIAFDNWFISIPTSAARNLVDRVHDAMDQFEAEQREETNP